MVANGFRTSIAPQAPRPGVIAEIVKNTAKRDGGPVTGKEARQHQDGVAVAARAGMQEAGDGRGEQRQFGYRSWKLGGSEPS